ncbi:MAG: cbb3-type cytochrome c oxidase subunit I [Bacteroidia bacterium]
MENKINRPGNLFLATALIMLLAGLVFGILAAATYIFPEFTKANLGFISLRPLHVSSALFWIIVGATGCVYNGIRVFSGREVNNRLSLVQWMLWLFAICGILISYLTKDFGGREYWEFNPAWALPIVMAWILFLVNFFNITLKIKNWPVYVWMWTSGIVFFMFTFLENYLWMFPYFREHFITDTTIQWKVNGSLVGSWNQMLYGTAFFLMDRISKSESTGRSKTAFFMFFLGLTNLMFNWGHHIYTLPTEKYIRYVGYIVSMTEWVFFAKIVYDWKKSLAVIQRHYSYFPYRFIMAADVWVFLNMGQAILMSIPAINLYTHGTHVTVAHAMGTTVGINSMILFAACFEFLGYRIEEHGRRPVFIKSCFWALQGSLFVFWLALNVAGIKKGLWQMSVVRDSYSVMMHSLRPYFITFGIAGVVLMIGFSVLAITLLRFYFSNGRVRVDDKQKLNFNVLSYESTMLP